MMEIWWWVEGGLFSRQVVLPTSLALLLPGMIRTLLLAFPIHLVLRLLLSLQLLLHRLLLLLLKFDRRRIFLVLGLGRPGSRSNAEAQTAEA